MNYFDTIDFSIGGSILKEEYIYLYNLCLSLNTKSILEFGPGISTYAFLEKKDNQIYSFEHDDFFYNKYKDIFKNENRVKIFKLDKEIILKNKYDLCFVDSPRKVKQFSRLENVEISSLVSDLIIIHDAKRKGEIMTINKFNELGWNTHINPIGKGLGFIYKDKKISKYF